MTETLAALLLALVLADLALGPGRSRSDGATGHPTGQLHPVRLLALAALRLALAQIALGRFAAPELLALAGVCLAADAWHAWLAERRGGDRLVPYLLRLALQGGAAMAVALAAPDLWAGGYWAGNLGPGGLAAGPAMLPRLMLLGAGLIVATRSGGLAVGLLMAAQAQADPPERGLPKGGTTIGLLERGLIYILILSGQPEATGFLIAAKSILRFGTVAEDRAASEYVIIGTLASFGWAITTALAVAALTGGLPPPGP